MHAARKPHEQVSQCYWAEFSGGLKLVLTVNTGLEIYSIGVPRSGVTSSIFEFTALEIGRF